MQNKNILLPNVPRVVEEVGNKGIYEIENLYPGYGHTLGNSLRRIVHSSIPGCAITSLKIEGVQHEFSTIEGVVEDVITIILHLKRVNFKMIGDTAETVTLSVKGEKKVYVNCFCLSGGNFIEWKKLMHIVDDGGSCFFNVIINLTTIECEQLNVNRSA